MKIKAISAFKRKFVFVQTLVLAFLLIALSALSSCTEKEEKEERICAPENSGNLSLGILFFEDSLFNVFAEHSGVLLQNSTALKDLIEFRYAQSATPVTLKLELDKDRFSRNDFIRYRHLDTSFYSISAKISIVTESCEQTPLSTVPFFLFEENESRYVFMSQIHLKNKESVGWPIFFMTLSAFERIEFMPIISDKPSIILIPVMDDFRDLRKSIRGYFQLEINNFTPSGSVTTDTVVREVGSNFWFR